MAVILTVVILVAMFIASLFMIYRAIIDMRAEEKDLIQWPES